MIAPMLQRHLLLAALLLASLSIVAAWPPPLVNKPPLSLTPAVCALPWRIATRRGFGTRPEVLLTIRSVRAFIGDDQPIADWLSTACSGLNARQQKSVAALFAAEAHDVLTRETLAALPEEVVEKILSPLPTGTRYLVASAAAFLRASHAGAKAHTDRLSGDESSREVDSGRRSIGTL